MSVLISDCKKGDVVFFRPKDEPAGLKPPKHKYRIGTIKALHAEKGTVSVQYRALDASGQVTVHTAAIQPGDIIGFSIPGTPL